MAWFTTPHRRRAECYGEQVPSVMVFQRPIPALIHPICLKWWRFVAITTRGGWICSDPACGLIFVQHQ
jgi:hypothetical protein